jgi:hypothetical protein
VECGPGGFLKETSADGEGRAGGGVVELTPDWIAAKHGQPAGSRIAGGYPHQFSLDRLEKGHVIGSLLGGGGGKGNLTLISGKLNRSTYPFDETRSGRAHDSGLKVSGRSRCC